MGIREMAIQAGVWDMINDCHVGYTRMREAREKYKREIGMKQAANLYLEAYEKKETP